MKTFSVAILASLALNAATAFAQAPAIPATPGDAAGTVTAGGKTVTLKHASAAKVPEDGGPPLHQVVLTDQPVPTEALATELKPFGGGRLLRAGKVSGISFLIDSKGNTRNVIPFAGDVRGSQSQGGGSLAKFTASPTGVTGQGKKDPGGDWSYAASFNAAIAK